MNDERGIKNPIIVHRSAFIIDFQSIAITRDWLLF